MNASWLITLIIAYDITHGIAGEKTDKFLKTPKKEVDENELKRENESSRISSKSPIFSVDYVTRKKRSTFQRRIPKYLNTFAIPAKDELPKVTIHGASQKSSGDASLPKVTIHEALQKSSCDASLPKVTIHEVSQKSSCDASLPKVTIHEASQKSNCDASLPKVTIYEASEPSSSKNNINDATRNRCGQCNVSFRYDRHYAKHCLDVHGIERPFSCDLCERMFGVRSSLIDHAQNHHGVKKNTYKRWKKNEPIICDACQKSVTGWTKFEQHVLSKHKGMKMMRCSHCPEKYFRRRDMLQHEKLEHGKLEVKCEICKNIFERSDLLKEHLVFCEQTQIQNKMGDKQLDTIIRYEMVVCEECGDQCKTHGFLKDHLRFKHPHVKLHPCDHCDAAFSNGNRLEKHVGMLHPDKTGEIKTWRKFKRGAIYTCEYCKENFTGAVKYQKHGKQHPGLPMFRCKDCDHGYSTQKKLRIHANELHGGVKTRCTFCSKCYVQIWSHEKQCKKKIEKRERKRMAGYPKHYCDICSRDFYTTDLSFKNHVFRHKNLDCCSICGQRFRRGKGGLYEHMERKHPLSENIEALQRTAAVVREFVKREETAGAQCTNPGTGGLDIRTDFYDVKAEAS